MIEILSDENKEMHFNCALFVPSYIKIPFTSSKLMHIRSINARVH